jgi:hypothetical protein
MARTKKHDTKSPKNGANLGFEATLWQAADKLRGNPEDRDESTAEDINEGGRG